ncbi:hypothetical protein [Streptomyces bottropensis]
MAIDVAVMDGDWRQEVRTEVIERVLAALADACGLSEPSPTWWVDFRVIDEGSWGSSGGVLSVLSLLDSGVFTEEKTKIIRAALSGWPPPVRPRAASRRVHRSATSRSGQLVEADGTPNSPLRSSPSGPGPFSTP